MGRTTTRALSTEDQVWRILVAVLTSRLQQSGKTRAFDLLEGITRAGALSLDEHAELHVVCVVRK